MPKSRGSVVVFSNVDLVLRDPHSRSFSTAAAVLKQLSRDEVALVLCSGKTRAELECAQQRLEIAHPFICENGGAALIPEGYFDVPVPNACSVNGYEVVAFGRSYADVVGILRRTCDRLNIGVLGFNDLSIEQVARECRLSLLQARLAKLREYEEPFRMLDPRPAVRVRLVKALQAAGLRCSKRDGFDRASGPTEIGLGVDLLRGLYQRRLGSIATIGVTHAEPGDSLLRLIDDAIVVPQARSGGDPADVIDWAEAIVDRVEELRKRPTVSAPPLIA